MYIKFTNSNNMEQDQLILGPFNALNINKDELCDGDNSIAYLVDSYDNPYWVTIPYFTQNEFENKKYYDIIEFFKDEFAAEGKEDY